MFVSHFPALVVVLPLLMAPVLFLIRHEKWAFYTASIVSVSAILMALGLVFEVGHLGVISYRMGGWDPLIGIEYRVDYLNLSFLLLLQIFGFIALQVARGDVLIDKHQAHRFYAAWVLACAGFSGILLTADIFNMFVFLEISSLSSYLLISFGKKTKAYAGAFNYLMFGTVAATFILLGIGFLYLQSGALNMQALFMFASHHPNDYTFFLGAGLVLIGLGAKVALFPMHGWLPKVYACAPKVVALFFVVSSTKVSAYLLMRLLNGVFFIGESFVWLYDFWFVLAALGILFANALAVFQKDWVRLLAYSSIGQLSYALLAMVVPGANALAVSVLQLLAHGVSKFSVFLCLVMLCQCVKDSQPDRLGALLRKRPLLMAAWVLGVLGLMGVPITFGFTAKWSLFVHLFDQEGHFWGVLVLVLGSLVSLGYGYRLLTPVLFYAAHSDHQVEVISWRGSWTYWLWVVVLINVFLALYSDWLFEWLLKIHF